MSLPFQSTPPRKQTTLDLIRAESQATPITRKESGAQGQKIELDGFEKKREAMCREMSGRWVGPCKVADFFRLTMPIELKKGSKEQLPKINKKFFAGKKPASEKAMVKKTIEFFGTDNFAGIQLVDTSNHPDPHSKRGAKLRPDISIRDKSDVIDPNSPTQLDETPGGLEAKNYVVDILSDKSPLFESETFTAQQARGQLATYAVELCARQHRTHLFFVYLFYPYARFIRFDGAGALVSERFNFTLDCTPLIRFFSRLSKMSRVERGYDPTVQVADEPETKLARERLKEWAPDPKYERPVFKMEVYDHQSVNGAKMPNPRKFLVWGALAGPESPLGRATRGYPALEVTHGLDQAKEAPLMFLKEQWRSIALRPEIDTLRELKDKEVKHVPTLECGGDLPGQVTQTAMYAAKIGKRGAKDTDTRIHVRFVVVEVGRPIERFSSSKMMFKAVYDAFQGHKQAYEKCKLLHRDVSGGNILLVKDGGILNDWDMAVNVEEVERGPRAHERTGTWAFMSIDLLMGEKRPHRISDDLESFFWVVLYHSLLYLPHNKVNKLYEIITGVFEQYTYYSEAKGGLGKYAMVTKGHHIGGDSPPPLEFTENAPLTEFVKTILKLMRNWKQRELAADSADNTTTLISGTAVLHLRSLGPKQPEVLPPPTEKEMRDDMEALFRFILSMAWPTDDKAQLHIVRKPIGATGQAPAEGTVGGGSKKRKSIDESDLESDDEEPKPKKVKSITSEALTEGPKERKSKKTPSVATRRSTRLHKGSTN
ncbi:hypothetical protein CCMSSC00406_0009990 [Pleurotus cornucopiae]|uniref:Uncharacterized protein n=1 Tax=Pleurotus cornucopiae TaxID=5321 RepID=A0ACB7JAX0_PLECO|nr:hypothetical protein CCMSSC00406_0009990 [Pleurotus cornucopiae]